MEKTKFFKGRDFTCDLCGETYMSSRSEEEAQEELVTNGFGDIPMEEMAVVCDDCYHEVMGTHHTKQ